MLSRVSELSKNSLKRSGGYAKRRNGDDRANPPKYRKNGDDHPHSTVTFKADGFKHDAHNNRIRLTKGRNLKDHWLDFILCDIKTRPDVVVENARQVRAVWNGDEWELHIVCKHEIETDPPGDETAGIDLGISNVAAVSYSTGDHELYPGNALTTDERYFAKEIAKCNSSRSNKALRLRRKRSALRTHYSADRTYPNYIHPLVESLGNALLTPTVPGLTGYHGRGKSRRLYHR